mmetsp:Transcript_4970/g.6563  ORF Transcript_4970/g.6563 Transcript_4970/m.6563 type:complete len:320 (+) Transcript_4970:80-1039(+)|eukprot:CAMPEP_0185264646 /NCGR_PEP_ID=MMETSP1359-20130426/24195_1 /TAXON_ID=552665 /ORGANISM="Bigelowiella longifila, Strain CCMP242" /LENGTH=319 /DNA_ID=CAMNT_0027853381 /DNA_START=35 /DNA_END=997 /DNA_ORIENTATION=+
MMGMGGYPPPGLSWFLWSVALCFNHKFWTVNAAATEMLTIQIGPAPKRFQLDHTMLVPKRMEEYACTSLDGPECYLIDGGKKKEPNGNEFIEKISSLIGDALEKTVGLGRKKKSKKKKTRSAISKIAGDATDRGNENESGGPSTEGTRIDEQDTDFPGLKQQIETTGHSVDQQAVPGIQEEDDEDEEEEGIEHLNGAKIAESLARKLSSIIDGDQLDGVQHVQSFRILPNGEAEQMSATDLEDMLSGIRKKVNKDADYVDDDDEEEEDNEREGHDEDDNVIKIGQLGELLNHLAMNSIGEHGIILDQIRQDEDEEDEND